MGLHSMTSVLQLFTFVGREAMKNINQYVLLDTMYILLENNYS